MPFYADDRATIHHGDCLDVLRTLPDASVDAVVTDPPYELAFMGRSWDRSGIAYRVELWAECLRVLKPGGHLLAFGGTRTWHRLVCAVEDAGFEIRDSIAWLYGSGFPKSLNIGDGRGTALKPAHEPIVVARKPLVGTVAANVEAYGTGALNIDACRVGGDVDTRRPKGSNPRAFPHADDGWVPHLEVGGSATGGRWPTNVVLDEHAADQLDQQSGDVKAGGPKRGTHQASGRRGGLMGQVVAREADYDSYGDTGGASRFFPIFRYQSKAPARERPKVDGVAHPTVKPLALMQWLCRLVTPPGGTVLEPFAGSGTTIEAALREGFRCVAIEREADYLPLIAERLARIEPDLFAA